MENAVDALKMAFAVFIFVMALTLAITMFSQANEVSKIVLSSSDITQFYDYEQFKADGNKQARIVGLETIIPTLYKYYKENYTVVFLNETGAPLPLYENQIANWKDGSEGTIAKYYTTDESEYERYKKSPVCSFDVDEESARNEPWLNMPNGTKTNLDAFLQGGTYSYNTSLNSGVYNYNNRYLNGGDGGFINTYGNRKFKETLGEYTFNLTEDENGNTLLKNKKKRVIVYQLQSI